MAKTIEDIRKKYYGKREEEREEKAASSVTVDDIRQKYYANKPAAKNEGKPSVTPAAPVSNRAQELTDPRLNMTAQQKQQQTAATRRPAAVQTAGEYYEEKTQENLNKTPTQDRARMTREKSRYQLGESRATSGRVGKAIQGIGLNTPASVEYLGETTRKAMESTPEKEAMAEAFSELNLAAREFGYDSPEYARAKALYDLSARAMMDSREAVDPNSRASQMMAEAQRLQQEALEGTSGVGRWLGEAAISMGSNLAKMPLNLIVPGSSAALLGIEAAAGKAYEGAQRGESAARSLARGITSGAIEFGTELVPLGTLADIVNKGGTGALSDILKQAGVEGGEEALSYLANWIADKAARDPEARFDMTELLSQAAAGALSGGLFGAAGTVLNRLGQNTTDNKKPPPMW